MRLGQLSRKLGLRVTDIHGFLAEKSQIVEAGPNTRLTDDQVLLVVRHFDPSKESAILKDELVADTVEEVTPVAPIATAPDKVHQESPVTQPESEAPVEAESTPEVIRAPKQELPGLKVVGKIELKEPRKKEEPSTPEQPSEEPRAPRPARTSRPIRQERQQRTWKNPLEAERQREAREKEERRQRELEADKARRTQKYLKKVKSVPTKPVRRQEEAVVETQVETRPAPKTWLGKIARWLTT